MEGDHTLKPMDENLQSMEKSFSDREVELLCDGFALYLSLQLPMRKRAADALQLARRSESFRDRLDKSLAHLSRKDESGIQILNLEQAERIRTLYSIPETGQVA